MPIFPFTGTCAFRFCGLDRALLGKVVYGNSVVNKTGVLGLAGLNCGRVRLWRQCVSLPDGLTHCYEPKAQVVKDQSNTVDPEVSYFPPPCNLFL